MPGILLYKLDIDEFIDIQTYQSMSERFHLKESTAKHHRVQHSFDISEPFELVQQGMPANYNYSDYIYVPNNENNASQLHRLPNSFRTSLAKIVKDNFHQYALCGGRIRKEPEIPQVLISSFDTELWNHIGSSKVEHYRPAWNDEKRKAILHQSFPERKKNFFKFNIKMFFQVKKNLKGQNPLTLAVQNLLNIHKLTFRTIEGQPKEFCGVKDTVFAGRFIDGFQKPKDPYSFFIHCLIGYDHPQHLGGSYLLAQKCVFDWNSIHANSESLSGVVGRNEIIRNSTIFSQHHCPRSHIRLSRIKDDLGNPVSLHRESKTYSVPPFSPLKERGITDNINPQQGIFFIAYHKSPLILQKMMINQLGNNDKPYYDDGLLNLFTTDYGNILYTPNFHELTESILVRPKLAENVRKALATASLSCYHQVRWLKNYKRNEDDEDLFKKTGNPYYLYSRAGYLRRMSEGHEENIDLNPPSPRTLRIISKTFSLWQDTWYYDRKQRQIEDLEYFLNNKPFAITALQKDIKDVNKFSLNKYKNIEGEWIYNDIPMGVRNGLATYYLLGYVLSTFEYGCRGPVDKTSNGRFGANTFHLEPEDVLAGGEANLTFGQGKHIIQYLTQTDKQNNWLGGLNLSAQSGIGHVVPYMEEIMQDGLEKMIKKFKAAANHQTDPKKIELFVATVFALLGLQQYFINYADYAQTLAKSYKASQEASVQSLWNIAKTMRHLSTDAPTNLHEGAQLVLSLFICLHITGEPVSVGRLDYVLRKFAKPLKIVNNEIILNQEDQDIVDSFWIKIGEKANFNKGFFEDHQKWGNLAMGGNSFPYPQGASFNQWGHQLTVGGSNQDNTPFYNSITAHCLRAARTVPVNAPCLGLRLVPNMPPAIIQEAAKAILAGGAHPILLNDQKIIQGLRQSGNYEIDKDRWEKAQLKINGKEVIVPYNNWKTKIKEEHLRDFTSDGCHEFLIAGRSWFWLGGGPVLIGLEYVLNVGKTLLDTGPRYIYGRRNTYRDRPLSTYQRYDQLQEEYFATFEDIMRAAFHGELSGYSNMSNFCPSSLLNAFTANMITRGSDFHENGTEYKLFCPQYTGVANLVNSLWNLKRLVFELQVTNLQEVRNVLVVNWGDQLGEPFVSTNIPPNMRDRLKNRCEVLRQLVWSQPKFGTDPEVTKFGLRITNRLSEITRKIFAEPTDDMLLLFKTLTYRHGSQSAPFGFQYLPGCGTFENYDDAGTGCGASFDGRKKGQTLAQDYSPQNYLMDKAIGTENFEFKSIYTSDIIENFSYDSSGDQNPKFFSGAVLDLNIDENYSLQALVQDITSLARGKGTNLTTVTVASRDIMEEARRNTERDLLRFRMGGWTEFAVAMFPHLLEQHIRRVREIHPAIVDKEEKEEIDILSKKHKKE